MLLTDVRPMEILNNLITINNDRIEGYSVASRATDARILKDLFERLAETSLRCREELCREVHKLGGRPADSTMASPEIFKAWLNMMAAIGKNDHPAILNSCVREERIVIDHYENALHEDDQHITTQHHFLFGRHRERLISDQEKVSNLLRVLGKN